MRLPLFGILTLLSFIARGSCDDVIPAEAAKPILFEKCGSCHRGPYLDFSQYPFYSDRFVTEPLLAHEALRRLELDSFGMMPPVNGKALTDEEKAIVLNWLRRLEQSPVD